MRSFLLSISFILFIQINSFSQKYEVKGVIRDEDSGETLVGATVLIDTLSRGTLTDVNGKYSLLLPAGNYRLKFSFIGYDSYTQRINLKENIKLDVVLRPLANDLNEVIIEAQPLKEKLRSSQMSLTNITAKEAKMLPALLGEVDVFKSLQLKPGVKSGGEGSSGLYIRGGGADQNLVLIDNAVVYNPFHLFGFFSIFNSDAIKDVELYKGGFPAEYGGRLSSVVDVRQRIGNNQKFSGTGGLGVISSRLTLETPISKKSSVILSGRRTYVDVFTRLLNERNENNINYDPIPSYFFYDLNGKVSYNLGKKDKILVSGYYGNDVFRFNDDNFKFNFFWGNRVAQTQWEHNFRSNFRSRVSLIYARYNYEIRNKFDDFSFNLGSQVEDYTALVDFSYYPNTTHSIKYGLFFTRHAFEVGRLKAGDTDGEVSFKAGNDFLSNEFGGYISDNFIINKVFTVSGGIRASGFFNRGKMFYGLEPRVSVKSSLTENVSAKGSYSRMYQYVHLVSNSSASLPTDIWYPSNELVKPQVSDQVALGLSVLSKNKKILFTNEVYYKWMDRQIDFRDGSQLFLNSNLEREFVFGKGYSYGNEIYLEKTQGKTTGWIGYTVSWTKRQFDEIDNGKAFFARHDRRHDISVVMMYQLSKRISLSGTWVYGTGNAVTVPTGRLVVQEVESIGPKVVPIVERRNGFRMRAYHRMDASLVYKFFPRWGESDLTLSIYNLYNRRNPYFMYIDEVKDEEGATQKFQAKQVSLFPIIPSLTYNFKF